MTAHSNGLYIGDSPTGPFEFVGDFIKTDGTTIRPIDSALFNDDDGRIYIYWFEQTIPDERGNFTAMTMGVELFAPHFTAYDKRLMYQEYDVTDMLREENRLSVVAAEGWAVGNMTILPGKNKRYSDSIKVIYSLEAELSSGKSVCVASDGACIVTTSRILSSSIYNGETIDKTAKIKELGKAEETDFCTTLIQNEGEKVKEQETVYPARLVVTPKGERVIDFGQNMTGCVEITARGKKGDRIKISHAEILDKDGNFYNENLRSAKQINTYVLSGEDKEKTAAALSKMIKKNGNKLDTGFVGTPYLLSALSDNGYADTAYDLLFQEGFPSWIYSVNNGATTMWEHWDGIKEDGTVWDKVMNSTSWR